MNNKKMLVTIEVPEQDNIAWGGYCEIIAKIPKYKKWWHFWKDNYEEVPCKITNII